MDKPKWQLARSRVSGRLVWVASSRPVPTKTPIFDTGGGGVLPAGTPVFFNCIIDPDDADATLMSPQTTYELLPEFADEVELITYQEWLRFSDDEIFALGREQMD
jgi:hypothetical protein